MKAVIKTGYDAGMVEYTEFPKPEVGDSDVLIKVKAAGICGSDLPLFYGKIEGKTVPYPIVIGHEFAGEICEVGSRVTDWKVGDRVVSDNTGYVCGKCYACATGQYLFCEHRKGMGNDMDGGFAEYVKIPGQVLSVFPNCLYKVPESISYEHASILDPLCNAYKAVVQEAKVLPGQTVIVFGVGALGLFSIKMAHIIGASKIIAVGLSEDQETRFGIAKECGATDFVVSDKEDVIARCREIAGEEGVAAVIDCAGIPMIFKQAIEITRNGGCIVKIGESTRPLEFSLHKFGLKGLVLIGHMGYDSTSWRNCIRLLEKGEIDMDAIISHKIPMSKVLEGIELVRNKAATKVVLLPEEDVES